MALSDPSEREGGGTWGSSEAAADWQRGVAARLRMFGSPTEQLRDQANIRAGSRVLDIGAGAGDQTLGAARLAVRRRHEAGRRPRTLYGGRRGDAKGWRAPGMRRSSAGLRLSGGRRRSEAGCQGRDLIGGFPEDGGRNRCGSAGGPASLGDGGRACGPGLFGASAA